MLSVTELPRSRQPNKTEAGQWTCVETLCKCWNSLLQRGRSSLYTCWSTFTCL